MLVTHEKGTLPDNNIPQYELNNALYLETC